MTRSLIGRGAGIVLTGLLLCTAGCGIAGIPNIPSIPSGPAAPATVAPAGSAAPGPAPATTPAAGDGPGTAELDACAHLPLALAEQTIEHRTSLQTASAPGGPECLYGTTSSDPNLIYSVDLDLSTATDDSLEMARAGYAQPNVVIADEPSLGEGAFSALNLTSASVDCVADGVMFDVSVGGIPFPPEAVPAQAEFALRQARALAAEYCG